MCPVDVIEFIAMYGKAALFFHECADDGSPASAGLEHKHIGAIDRGQVDKPVGEVRRGLKELQLLFEVTSGPVGNFLKKIGGIPFKDESGCLSAFPRSVNTCYSVGDLDI